MALTWNDLSVNFAHIERETLLADWQWLVGDAMPILVSAVGDAFLQNEAGEIYWLETGSGEFEQVAHSYEDFQAKLRDKDLVHDWFLVPIVAELKEQGLTLEPGKLYGFKKLPILGGEYEAENFELTDIQVHFAISGQINFQIKDLPDGAQINFSITE